MQPHATVALIYTAAMDASRWFFTRLGRLWPPARAAPLHPRPPNPSGDVYVPFGNNGLGSAYDVTLCPRYWGPSWPLPHVPLVTSSPPSSVKLPSTPAFVLRWTFACPTCSIDFWSVVWHLVPPDFSHCGPPSGSHWSTQWVALFRALFVATQRSIARDILDRASRLPEHAPLLSPCPS
jgi:hypothetical protein